jgi:histone acetyltransferase MYST1
VERIIMGYHEIQTWYYSPFPEAYSNVSTLYVCEYCLSYMRKGLTYKRNHVERCKTTCPPGRRIYLEGDLAVYEIDGKDHKPYCQKLCLLAKLFLDHKTLYYDVTPFLFYVVCTVDRHGAKMVGYFSKEKVSDQGYNLACILTLPQYQHKGYGKFIIRYGAMVKSHSMRVNNLMLAFLLHSLSYELTKREGKTGSPEKPLSDLGKVSYRSYWTHVLIDLLNDHDPNRNLSILDMSIRTGIKTEDIISTLQFLDMIKVWKGQHVAYIKQSTLRSYLKQQKCVTRSSREHAA